MLRYACGIPVSSQEIEKEAPRSGELSFGKKQLEKAYISPRKFIAEMVSIALRIHLTSQ
jgi:hypothetical protein